MLLSAHALETIYKVALNFPLCYMRGKKKKFRSSEYSNKLVSLNVHLSTAAVPSGYLGKEKSLFIDSF